MTDALDEQLVTILQKNSWQSSEAIAKQLEVSPATVRRRIRKLIQSGIVRMVALVDPKKLGYHLSTMIAFDVEREELESVIQMLAEQQEVKWISTTTGRFDILVLARFRSTEELSEFVQRKLADVQGITGTETFICLQVAKGGYIQI